MEAPRMIEINGEKYISTKTAADLWNLKPRTVADYCSRGRIIKAFKNGKNGWYIHIDEIKPLSNLQIHQLLVLTIQLKNNPKLLIDWETFVFDDNAIDNVYKKLVSMNYVMPYTIKDAKRIPYEVVLTQTGLEMATTFHKQKIPDFSTTVSQWLPVLISAAQLYFQIKG